MTHIFISWLMFIGANIAVDWHQIFKLKIPINHSERMLIRCVLGLVFWIATPFVGSWFRLNLPFDVWLAMPPMMAFTFWALFDAGLNLARGKSILYFGTGPNSSRLDRLQAKWPLPWVFFKFFFAAIFTYIYFIGWNAVIG